MKIRDEKGFSLIELALILVIIGIIISIVLKGQDVIESSRMKKFETEIRHWRSSAWLFLERKGTFPGDTDNNGIMGDEATPVPGSLQVANQNLMNAPKENPINAGSLQFWLYWGNNGGTESGGVRRNVMVICANDDCTLSFEDSGGSGNMKYVEFIDAVVDGVVDGANGLALAATTTPVLDPPEAGAGNERAVTSVGDFGPWESGLSKALVYFIDKRL